MKKYLKGDAWNIIEEDFHPDLLRNSESIFSLGNGRIGERGTFEESYSSDSYRASFVAGISAMKKTRVGWWKIGFPYFYSYLPQAVDWSRIDLRLMDEELNLAHWDIKRFKRQLNMHEGMALRDMEVTSPRGKELSIKIEHINNMAYPDLCLIKWSVTSQNYSGKLSLLPILDGKLANDAKHYEEKSWNVLGAGTTHQFAYLWTQTRYEDTHVCYAMTYHLLKNGKETSLIPIRIEKEKEMGFSLGVEVHPGDTVTLIKYVAVVSSLYQSRQRVVETAIHEAKEAQEKGWNALLEAHRKAWLDIWNETDVRIEGDLEAQQGIRYNIFQLYQTYRGDDPRLNISPKGFTGERYGGNTYWNTELCCVPFFLLSTSKEIVHNLLLYRYNQLPKAIENAEKLGFKNGAALFPQVTSNGEECHNEWEITFEEIHRNNIIIHAIVQYAQIYDSLEYVAQYGMEVMIAVCRFWAQRVSFSKHKQRYVILGVTGPDEYQNNVDNNWYTNYSTQQSLQMTLKYLKRLKNERTDDYERICRLTHFSPETEIPKWQDIADRLYLPEDKEKRIFVQNDGFLDKELQPASLIPENERPINQHWSWDRILRSCYIKQSDVLLGIYLFNDSFDQETVRRNFDFYEPMTVHESSLSPYIHAILAARIGYTKKAYQLFMNATRLDLDDYNNETDSGLHITSMPGSWLAIVRGFAGMQILNGTLKIAPILPENWKSYDFQVNFKGRILHIKIGKDIRICIKSGKSLELQVHQEARILKPGIETVFNLSK